MSFCDLHTHSDYSIFDGFATIEDKIKRAKELGYTALAMTEHGTTTGLMEFYLQCKKADLKPILGYEGYFSFETSIKGSNTYHILLLAKNLTGYRNLMKLATRGTENFYRKPRIGIEDLKQYHDGIICSTACIGGVLSCEEPEKIAKELYSIFKEDFYLEIQPHNFKEQKEYNTKVVRLGKKLKIPVIITGDSHYVNKSDAETHRMWLNLAQDSEYYGSGDYHMMSELEMREFFNFNVDEYFKNVSDIIDKCNVEIPLGEENFPIFDTPDVLRFVKDRCNEGWKRLKINEKPNWKQYKQQALHEFEVLEKCNYLNYFCIIYDMLNFCREKNIPVGPGRGSVGGSLVAYLMGITEVDPIRFNLVFERFANPERVTSPDIDCDISSERRDEVIEYIKQKYGEVYQIRTITYIQPKSAVIRAGQALGYDPQEARAISTKINTLDEVKDEKLKALAEKFMGHIEKYSVHASAVVVFPRDVSNWCAVEKSNDSLVAAQDFHLLEKQGIMKLDILGLKNLDIIDWTLKRIGTDKGLKISEIPLEDDYTARMLRAGFTSGCFQIESSGMTEIIKAINTKRVEDLIDTVALHRPGPLDSGMVTVFEKRRQGEEPVSYLHPKLEPILKDTEGIILYQEQIMQIARDLCGYTYGEADNLRRIIGRKIVDEMQPVIDDMKRRGLKNGIPETIMEEICNEIITFANYGFNKGHSAAYGLLAWYTSFLKAHYTPQYMASLLEMASRDTSSRDKLVFFIEHCKKLRLTVVKPDLYKGQMECIANDKTIIMGFNAVAGVGKTVITPYNDAIKFLEKNVNLNKTVLKNIIRSGACDNYTDKTRWELLEYVDWLKDKRKSKGEFKYSGEEVDSYGEMEYNVLRYTFTDIFQEYDTDIVDGNTNVIAIVTKVKPHKTKKGKPMAFVEIYTSTKGAIKAVMFEPKFEVLKKGKVYIMQMEDTMIKDFIVAQKKT